MGKDIDFQVRLQLNRAADEFVENETKSADRAEDRFLVAFKCDGALDPEGRIIVSWRDGVREFEEMRRSAERINLVESFTENILLVPSDELRARLIASDELRAWLLDGLLKFFCSSKVDENFLVGQAWKAEKWLPVDDDFFRFKAYQLLRNQDQPQQAAPPAEDQEAKSAGTKAEIITDNRKRLSDQLFEETLLPIIFEKLEKSNSITSKKGLYNQIAEPYEFTGHTVRKRFDEKYRPHTEKLHEALRKYGNEELISQIKNIR